MSVRATSLMVSACKGGKDRRILVGLDMRVSLFADMGHIREYIPGRAQDGVPQYQKLRNNAKDIEVGTIRKEKVPQAKHFWKWGRAGAQSEDGREGIQLRAHALARQVKAEFWVDDGKDLVYKREALVHAIHGPTNVAWALVRDKAVEGDESLCLTTGGVEERGREDVHALDVSSRFRDCCIRSFCKG